MQQNACIYEMSFVIIVLSNDVILLIKINIQLTNDTKTMTNDTICTLSSLWMNRLPSRFPKLKCVDALAEHLGVANRNAYERIIGDKLLAKDVSFLFANFGIGFDNRTGFFFDEAQFDIIQQREEMENAALFGLSKATR